jgi:hypothetical protein
MALLSNAAQAHPMLVSLVLLVILKPLGVDLDRAIVGPSR